MERLHIYFKEETDIFWIGFIVGMVITAAALVGFTVICCKATFGTKETFDSMVDVVTTAALNPVSEVKVFHDGEELDASAIFGAWM